jgi:LytS/YehU family sensor histidine kinase
VLEKESIRAKYESLKSQVSPHFLFNSLNALTNLVYEDQDKAAKFIKQLSEVYRYVLDSRDKEVVPLEEEKKFLNSYLFLQQIRFGDKLMLEINLSDTRSLIAPLVLQMLVENAIKHNVISAEQPLTIRIYSVEGYIVVENDLQKKSVVQGESQGIGLENISRRYEFLTDRKVEVIEGDTFRVKLPVIPLKNLL